MDLGHGDLIGRVWSAALCVDDGRVSEAHAMISLRGGELMLLALRGRFAVDGTPLSSVSLVAGLTVELAAGLALQVLDVVLPDALLAIEADGLGRRMLTGVCSLVVGPPLSLISGYRADAAARLWCTDGEWRLSVGAAAPRDVVAGDEIVLGGVVVRFVAVPLSDAGAGATRMRGGVHGPLRIVAHYDSVLVHRDGIVALALGGVAARLVSELVSFDGPAPWEVLAAEVWRDGADAASQRRRLDVALARLRAKLRQAQIRDDLVRADGSGTLQLLLHDGDVVEDRT